MKKTTRKEKHENYDGFVEKFNPKKTTDDCYTPPKVYEAIKNWACEKYGINPDNIVRPFYPGGDYEKYEYPEGAVVLDNPPFSILSKILDFYIEKDIPFFLFAPAMTIFSSMRRRKVNAVIVNADIIYENGANVKTGFLTTFGDWMIEASTELDELIKKAVDETLKEKSKTLPKYIYPGNVLMVSDLKKIVSKGVEFKIKRDDAYFVRQLDSQKNARKAIYGSGFLISEKAATEKAAAEKAAAEKAAVNVWELSEREKEIIRKLG